MRALSATGLGRFWLQPTGAAFRENKMIRYGVIGSADISGILIDGRRFECEVKTGQAKQSKRQRDFQKMIEMMGGVYLVARSVEGAVAYLKSVAADAHR